MNNNRKIKQKGFTLLELLIVIAIIGVLATVALPSFKNQIIKAKRSEAMEATLECAAIQERRFTMRASYDDKACDSLEGTLEEYEFTVEALNSSDGACSNKSCIKYTITTSPKTGSQQESDKECIEFTINELGRKTAKDSGGTANTENCWRD